VCAEFAEWLPGLADFCQTVLRLNQFIRRKRDFSNRFGNVYGNRNDYPLYEVNGRFFDTVVAQNTRTIFWKRNAISNSSSREIACDCP
jgi:hypothetical protein